MLGKLLDGRYQVVQVLSAGGFGQTYIAQDTRRPGNPICVVKHLKPASSEPNYLQTARRLFTSEAETLEQLGNHDQIPRLLAYFEENQEFFLVQEFIAGRPLTTELRPNQPWTESEVIELLKDVLGILAFVHRYGVIHRDIKPDNLIRRTSDGKLVLIDFGAVKQVRVQTAAEHNQMNATVAIGTPGYMASEQGLGRPHLNSDIYALGILGIQALTGLYPNQLREDPTTGELLWQHQVQVSAGLASVLTQMVRYDYRERYQSANEVLQAIAQLPPSFPPTLLPSNPPLPVTPTQALPVAPSVRNPPPAAGSKKFLLLLGGLFVVVSTVTAIVYVKSVSTVKTPLNEFDNAQFPQSSCGDSLPSGASSSVQFYPVFIDYSENNLQAVKSNFCADAYRTTRKDSGEVAIQVASFTNPSRAELFGEFMSKKLGSGEVGQPTIISANSSTETSPQQNCSTVVSDPQPPLNVRSTPDDTQDNVVGTLEDGTPLSVVTEQNDWLQISSPLQGWVSKSRTKTVCQ